MVYLQGARQVGKTTLARQLLQTGTMEHYFSFDDPAVLSAAAQDPADFVQALSPHTVLEEVQRVPAVMPVLKMRVNTRRQAGDLLLTGSANPLMLPHLSETPVGRMAVVTLMTLSQGEIEGREQRWVEVFSHDALEGDASLPSDLPSRVVRGGYPEAIRRADPYQRTEWVLSYVDSLLARDVREIAAIQRLTEVPRLLQLLAAQTCQTLNVANLSRETGVPQSTLQRYLALLETLFILVRVPAWYTNVGKRLLKSPKILLNDTGLACALLGIDEERLASAPLLQGRMVENLVGNGTAQANRFQRSSPTTVSLPHRPGRRGGFRH